MRIQLVRRTAFLVLVLLSPISFLTSVLSQAEARVASESPLKPLVRVVDLSMGESQSVELHDGKQVTVKLLDLKETADDIRSAIRDAQVNVEIDGKSVKLHSGNYHLPVTTSGVQIDCPVTRGYYKNTGADHWGLDKDKAARLRLWPAGTPLVRPGTFVYPIKQRWFASQTWMSNQPVDAGVRFAQKIYYHSGLDIGGAEGMTEVIAATDGLVVSTGENVLDPGQDTPVEPRYDIVYVKDRRGWYYRYSHMQEIDDRIKPGRIIRQGDRIGLVGKEGGSGGWSHLHFEIKSRQPSGKWGTQDGYAFLWEAYLNQYKPNLIAVARPSHLTRVGEKVLLDGSLSWTANGEIAQYEWILSVGSTASGAQVEQTYPRPGAYSEILKTTDSQGRVDYDFNRVLVVDNGEPGVCPPYILPAHFPTFGIQVGDPVKFLVRSFNFTTGQEVWDFGDGSPLVQVQSDGNVATRAKDGYAVTTHRFTRPGNYIVRVERTNDQGVRAEGHLHIQVNSDMGTSSLEGLEAAETPTEKIRLFNGKNLDGFYTWLSDTKREDPRQVFRVTDGMLHVTGDGLGSLTSKQEYRDYHCVLEYKWGVRTWGARKASSRDSGLLVHSVGADGGYKGIWMPSIEVQIIEGGIGDFILVAGNDQQGQKVPLSLTCETSLDRDGEVIWKRGGHRKTYNLQNPRRINWYGRDPDWKDILGFQGKNDVDSPYGEWTRLDVLCEGGHIQVYVNGIMVNEAFDSYPSQGRLQLQTELAEIFVRRWELWPLGRAPNFRPVSRTTGKSD